MSVTAIFAKNPDSVTMMQQTIKSQISYPVEFIQQQIQGSVFIEFTIKEDGKIEILNCNAFSGDLMVYVVEKLSSLTLEPSPEMYGEKYLMRFDFKLE